LSFAILEAVLIDCGRELRISSKVKRESIAWLFPMRARQRRAA
jgi:hypothetical protein